MKRSLIMTVTFEDRQVEFSYRLEPPLPEGVTSPLIGLLTVCHSAIKYAVEMANTDGPIPAIDALRTASEGPKSE